MREPDTSDLGICKNGMRNVEIVNFTGFAKYPADCNFRFTFSSRGKKTFAPGVTDHVNTG